MSETDGEALWAEVARPDFEQQRLAGGSCGPPRASPTGIPVDLGDLGGGLDRRALILVLAAMAHAAGSHNHRAIAYDPDGIPRLGDPMPLLVAWPLRD
jgi:hypothetical protein